MEKDIGYVEVVSNIASRSARPCHPRSTWTEYIETTEAAIEEVFRGQAGQGDPDPQPGGALRGHADHGPGPNAHAEYGQDQRKHPENGRARSRPMFPATIYVLGPVYENGRVVVTVKVQAGDYLPPYAGNLDIINCAAIAARGALCKIQTSNVLICDPTLRDGNHAVQHQLSREQIAAYAAAANAAGIPIVEVGHGNGLGASSLQVGLSKTGDKSALEAARKVLSSSKLGVHVIPGFATIKKDLQMAVDIGVDVFRIASHCSEADLTERHISYVRDRGREVYGVLMMSHMASKEVLVEEASKMQAYGAEALIIMDSAGAYLQGVRHGQDWRFGGGLGDPGRLSWAQ